MATAPPIDCPNASSRFSSISGCSLSRAMAASTSSLKPCSDGLPSLRPYPRYDSRNTLQPSRLYRSAAIGSLCPCEKNACVSATMASCPSPPQRHHHVASVCMKVHERGHVLGPVLLEQVPADVDVVARLELQVLVVDNVKVQRLGHALARALSFWSKESKLAALGPQKCVRVACRLGR